MGREVRGLMAMKTDKPRPCPCGNKKPHVDTDDFTAATFIECGKCGRTCGSKNKTESLRMWNVAMVNMSDPPK